MSERQFVCLRVKGTCLFHECAKGNLYDNLSRFRLATRPLPVYESSICSWTCFMFKRLFLATMPSPPGGWPPQPTDAQRSPDHPGLDSASSTTSTRPLAQTDRSPDHVMTTQSSSWMYDSLPEPIKIRASHPDDITAGCSTVYREDFPRLPRGLPHRL